MTLKQVALEFVDLIRVDHNGQEHRESMPRWLAEITIACIPAEEPEIACAKIEPIRSNPKSPYPIKQATPDQIRYTALYLATGLPFRLAD